jgi:nucleoid DNA-binding protein
MEKQNKQIRQAGFVREMKKALEEQQPELAAKLDEKDLLFLIELFFKQISVHLRSGLRVIFEGFASFYTKPIARKCTNLRTEEDWMTYKRRLRWSPLPDMKKATEIEITKEQYLEETKK